MAKGLIEHVVLILIFRLGPHFYINIYVYILFSKALFLSFLGTARISNFVCSSSNQLPQPGGRSHGVKFPLPDHCGFGILDRFDDAFHGDDVESQ